MPYFSSNRWMIYRDSSLKVWNKMRGPCRRSVNYIYYLSYPSTYMWHSARYETIRIIPAANLGLSDESNSGTEAHKFRRTECICSRTRPILPSFRGHLNSQQSLPWSCIPNEATYLAEVVAAGQKDEWAGLRMKYWLDEMWIRGIYWFVGSIILKTSGTYFRHAGVFARFLFMYVYVSVCMHFSGTCSKAFQHRLPTSLEPWNWIIEQNACDKANSKCRLCFPRYQREIGCIFPLADVETSTAIINQSRRRSRNQCQYFYSLSADMAKWQIPFKMVSKIMSILCGCPCSCKGCELEVKHPATWFMRENSK